MLVVIGQIGAGKSTLCQELVSMVGARHLDIENLRCQYAGDGQAPAIAGHIASAALSGPTVFECTGASRDFEEIVEQLRLRGLRSFVVLLDCSMRTAMRHIRGQARRLRPRSGGTWDSQMRWTESQLRLVPADLTLSSDTTDPARITSIVLRAWERAERWSTQVSIPGELSFSRLVAFEVCPKSYRFKYVDNAPAVAETSEVYLSRRLHEALAWLYGKAAKNPDRSQLVDWFRERLEETLPSGAGNGTARHLFEAGRKALVFHHDVVYNNERTRTLAVEKTVRMNLGKGMMLVGCVDRIALDSSGTVEVIDYKASRERHSSRPRIPDGLEIAAQSVAVLLAHDLPSVIARQIILATGEEQRFALTARDVRQVTLSLRRWVARQAASGAYPPRVGAHCSSCQFNPICEEGTRFQPLREYSFSESSGFAWDVSRVTSEMVSR